MVIVIRKGSVGTAWQRARGAWYGNQVRDGEWGREVSLWYTSSHDPVRLRWGLLRYEEEEPRTGSKKSHVAVFFCTETAVSAPQVLAWFVGRWNIEVTCEETRAHLRFETPWQWPPRAIGHTTPCRLGLCSLVVLVAQTLSPHSLPVRQNAW